VRRIRRSRARTGLRSRSVLADGVLRADLMSAPGRSVGDALPLGRQIYDRIFPFAGTARAARLARGHRVRVEARRRKCRKLASRR
jgi:hypothetical protein